MRSVLPVASACPGVRNLNGGAGTYTSSQPPVPGAELGIGNKGHTGSQFAHIGEK